METIGKQLKAVALSEHVIRQVSSHVTASRIAAARIFEQVRPGLVALQRTLANPEFFRAILEAWNARQREAAAILAEKGWWLAPDFPLLLLNEVVNLKAQGRQNSINRLICDYYTPRRLSSMIRRWNAEPLFTRRQHLFREALRAHREKRWFLSIPLLLTQVEGILADFADRKQLSKNASVKRMARALQVAPEDTSDFVVQTWLAQLDEIFGSGYYVTEVRHRGVRRNAILHGRELRYGSETKSTQLFLQLDTIYWFISGRGLPARRVT